MHNEFRTVEFPSIVLFVHSIANESDTTDELRAEGWKVVEGGREWCSGRERSLNANPSKLI